MIPALEQKLHPRQFTPNHYPIVCEWMRAHELEPDPLDYYPQEGVVIYYGSDPVASGFLMKTDTAYCYIEHLLVNPTAEKKLRDCGINMVIETLCRLGKKAGFKVALGYVNIEKLSKRAELIGFVDIKKNFTLYGKVL